MDIHKLCPKYGRRAMFGNIDVLIIAANDRDRFGEEILAKFEGGMATKG